MVFLLREKKIIKLLLENEKKFTTVQIAAELKVNQRTIKTDIGRINSELEKHSCYIRTKRGVGVWLESNSAGKRFLKELLYENDDDYISSEIRKYYIASELLNYKNYISMEQLANQYYVSKATVLNDINELDSFWEANRINITKKVKYGVRAEGDEKQIRRALFEAQKRIVEYFSGNALGKLQILYPNIDLQILENAIRQTEKTFSFVLTDISFIEFFIYIGIIVQRVKMGCEIEKNQDSAEYAGESREWFVCNFLCEQMKEHMQCSIPDFEMQGMMKRLKGLRFQVPMAKIREKNDLRSHNPELFDFMLDILREVDGKYLLNLEED